MKIIIKCCVCHKIKNIHDEFTKEEVDKSYKISHTYCPHCNKEINEMFFI